MDEDGKLLSLTINESIEDYRYEKWLAGLGILGLSVLTLAACGNKSDSKDLVKTDDYCCDGF